MSRSQELAAALVRTMTRVRAAEAAAKRFVAKHKTIDSRTAKNHQRLLNDILIAKNDLETIENMLQREMTRDAVI